REPTSIMYQAVPRPPPSAKARNRARLSDAFLSRLKGRPFSPVRRLHCCPALESPALASPDLMSPAFVSPALVSPALEAGALTGMAKPPALRRLSDSFRSTPRV